jgi:rubrerythrin
MKPLATTPREVLFDAIQSEVESREWMLKLAERAENDTVRDKLREFADREIVHRAQMEKKYKEYTGEEPPEPAEVTVNLPPELTSLDIRRAMKLILERERDAESNYRFLAERVPNTELGGLFMELAEIEWKHKADIQREYDNVVGQDPDSFLEDLG